MSDEKITLSDLLKEPRWCSTCPGCEKIITMSHEEYKQSVGAMVGSYYASNAVLHWHPKCYEKALKEQKND